MIGDGGQSVPFDRIVAIDWSGARAVRTQGIAVAMIEAKGCLRLVFPDDARYWSRQAVSDWLRNLTRWPGRTLVGIDCNLGYAASVMRDQLPGIDHAARLWSEVDRLSVDADNFFAEGFWTHPTIAPQFWCRGPQPTTWCALRRLTEQACADAGFGSPESPFKLLGPKQVGKGGLAGMRMLHALKESLGHRLAVWPFDLPTVSSASLLVTEIYPRLFIRKAGGGSTKVRDRSSLLRLLRGWSVCADALAVDRIDDHSADALIAAAGMLHQCAESDHSFRVPEPLVQVLALEGWIFGVPFEVPSQTD